MRITILLLFIGICLVSAKYLPYDESDSGNLIRSKRSDSDESDQSIESDGSSNDGEEEDKGDSKIESKYEKKRKELEEKHQKKLLELEEKKKRKEEEAQKKMQEKQEKEKRKEEEKREKEEQKRLEKIEKEKKKEEKIQKKILELKEKAERKKQKQEKELEKVEKLQKETLEGESYENDFLETEEENSVELSDIWRNHIYVKYGLNIASNKLEKQAAINKYLQEELGLTSNSTESERRQAIVKLIQTKLQNDSASQGVLKNQIFSQVNAITLYKMQMKLAKDIEELNNKSEVLNNVTLPWAIEMQQNIEEKKIFLQTIRQFLSNLFPNWANGEQNTTQSENTASSNNDLTVENAPARSTVKSSEIIPVKSNNTESINDVTSTSSNTLLSNTNTLNTVNNGVSSSNNNKPSETTNNSNVASGGSEPPVQTNSNTSSNSADNSDVSNNVNVASSNTDSVPSSESNNIHVESTRVTSTNGNLTPVGRNPVEVISDEKSQKKNVDVANDSVSSTSINSITAEDMTAVKNSNDTLNSSSVQIISTSNLGDNDATDSNKPKIEPLNNISVSIDNNNTEATENILDIESTSSTLTVDYIPPQSYIPNSSASSVHFAGSNPATDSKNVDSPLRENSETMNIDVPSINTDSVFNGSSSYTPINDVVSNMTPNIEQKSLISMNDSSVILETHDNSIYSNSASEAVPFKNSEAAVTVSNNGSASVSDNSSVSTGSENIGKVNFNNEPVDVPSNTDTLSSTDTISANSISSVTEKTSEITDVVVSVSNQDIADIVKNVGDSSMASPSNQNENNKTNNDVTFKVANNTEPSVNQNVHMNSHSTNNMESQVSQATTELIVTMDEAVSNVNTASDIAITEANNVSIKQVEENLLPSNTVPVVELSLAPLENGVTVPEEPGATVVEITQQ